MNMIVAADKRWGIGWKNSLLIKIPNDQKHFREETMGKVVVFGRKTLDTFPQKQVLPGRANIILSSKSDFKVKGAQIAHSLDELFAILQQYQEDDIYIIGGGSIYRQLLPYCRTVHVTKIDHIYEADCYFPNLDQDKHWSITGESEEQTYFDIAYRFLRYEKLN